MSNVYFTSEVYKNPTAMCCNFYKSLNNMPPPPLPLMINTPSLRRKGGNMQLQLVSYMPQYSLKISMGNEMES